MGCFAVGLEPTGSTDPFGLRRAALAILAIVLERGGAWSKLLPAIFATARDRLIADGIDVTDTDLGEVREFFRGRLRGVLIDDGIAAQDVDAALGAGFEDPSDARIRARDLAVVPREAREVFKRIANILDDAHGKGLAISGQVDPARFAAPGNVEHRLWDAFSMMRERADAAIAAQEYRRLFGVLVELQPAVAAFFDKGGVMVMDPDPALRDNRLSLLTAVLAPFAQVADFRALAVQS
jgi:glycyl-tRNA synthetase beta chain